MIRLYMHTVDLSISAAAALANFPGVVDFESLEPPLNGYNHVLTVNGHYETAVKTGQLLKQQYPAIKTVFASETRSVIREKHLLSRTG